MRLVDEDEIAKADLGGAPVDRLDAGEEDRRIRIAATEAGRIDAGWRLRPEADHLGMVLRDQLTHMGDDEDTLVGPRLEHTLDEGGHDQTLAASRRDHHDRMTLVFFEIFVDRFNRGFLVGAQFKHARPPCRGRR